MPPSDMERGSPADWLRHARSDLSLCKSSCNDDILPETLCFHAQQAVEKAIKAVLLSQGVIFPRSHNVGVLLDLLPSSIQRDLVLDEAAALTDYAVSSRYPGEAEDVTPDELAAAIEIAESVCRWATRLVMA